MRSSPLPRVVAGRRYVSESTKDAAQVTVESTIKADQKKFFAETGKHPVDQPMQGTGVNADAMMDPMAGMSIYPIEIRHL